MIEEFLSVASSAAMAAGSFVYEQKNKSYKHFDNKSLSSIASQIVTEIDLESQSIILNRMNDFIQNFDCGLLTEEATDDNSRFYKDFFIVIDPLDGTYSYTKQSAGYAISIALVKRTGEPIAGVVYDPEVKELYTSQTSINKYHNSRFQLILDKSYKQDKRYQNLIDMLAQTYGDLEIIDHQGAVLNAMAACILTNACYLKLPKNAVGGGAIWDFAATIAIGQNNGIICTDILGNPLKLNDKKKYFNHCGILYASTKLIHTDIIKAINILF